MCVVAYRARMIQTTELTQHILRTGFALVPASECPVAVDAQSAQWATFAATWDDLATDTYMADQGRYRRRRHAVFALADGLPPQREPNQPHYQTLQYNPLNGGVERWFAPVTEAAATSPILHALLAFGTRIFDTVTQRSVRWRVEMHQFRIEARDDEPGLPTPEGVHRDGVDFVLVVMIQRHNVRQGTTLIHDAAGNRVGEFTLERPLDMAWVDDHRVWHGVTPVEPEDPTQAAWRDVLVLTWVAQ